MLTRLKVNGFKNLVDVDIWFGPVTCVAGANGVGKSNLFDAITFLSALANLPLIEAARSIRDEGGYTADVRSLFHRMGDQYAEEMSFVAEMIVPEMGWDDLGQKATASITFLCYELTLAYKTGESIRSLGSLEVIRERLTHINLGDAKNHLPFPHSKKWRDSVVKGRRAGGEFISTEGDRANRTVKLHQDGGQGRPRSLLAANLPRTVLSVTNAAESPTALLARNEMRSWRLLQLEPTALRAPDPFTAPTHLGTDGAHLASTLYHLAGLNANGHAEQVYASVVNRLAELIDDVHSLRINRDDTRELLTLYVTDRYGTSHAARALSDGALRFLALAVLELDPEGQGMLCLEEPENGLHPSRIPAMLRLLSDLAVDVNEPIGPDNPLRQVIMNTHSPSVVGQVQDDSLLIAVSAEAIDNGQRFNRVLFRWLPETWRAKADPDLRKAIGRGTLLSYLNPVLPIDSTHEPDEERSQRTGKRVVDRPDMQMFLWPQDSDLAAGMERK